MTSGYPKKIVKPRIDGLMKASTWPRRRQAARRRAERRSSGRATGRGLASAARLTSRHLRAACRFELGVDLLVEVREPALEVVDLSGLILRHEGVDEVLVRAADEGDRRRPRVRIPKDVEEDVERLIRLDVG